MKEFDELIEVADKLNSPNGCPWDIKQTFQTLQPYVLEEAYELLEALDENSDEMIIEELGDLFYHVIFFSMVAQREGRFQLKEVIRLEKEKLIRRHPHVFSEEKAESIEEVYRVWEEIKAIEKKERKSLLDGIPKTADIFHKAQKILEKIHRHELDYLLKDEKQTDELEDQIAEGLTKYLFLAATHKIDSERVLRKKVKELESSFRKWEERVLD
ncbi:MAG: MazG family protein [Simkaniaceae bacterium]